MKHDFLRIAHRGASGARPENTLVAFERALEIGVDMLELDVHLTADGAPIVIHDDTLERTTNGTGPVKARALAELRRLDAGGWFDPAYGGERLPTLDEVLDLARGRAEVDIELKTHPEPYPGIESTVHRLLGRLGMASEVMVSSFNWDTLERYRALDGRMRLGLLADKPIRSMNDWVDRVGAWSLNLPPMLATGERYEYARSRGLKMIVWTVDDPSFIDFLVDYGVDGIISNHPERLTAPKLGPARA